MSHYVIWLIESRFYQYTEIKEPDVIKKKYSTLEFNVAWNFHDINLNIQDQVNL